MSARRNNRNATPSLSASEASHSDRLKRVLQIAWTSFQAKPWYYRVAAVLILLAIILLFHDADTAQQTYIDPRTQTSWRQNFSLRQSQAGQDVVTLLPGELPGYTGWARPATTLARHFRLDKKFDVTKAATAGEIYKFTIQCQQNTECAEGGALFFVRAYGPSVVTGIVTDEKNGSYQVELLFKDPGPYTVEVVLTFSNPPKFGQFPLPANQPEPFYEGYLLPEFPLPLQVVANPNKDYSYHKALPICEMEELLQDEPNSAWEKARWVVTDKMNAPQHTVDDPKYAHEITFPGYENNPNGLGITMDYHYDDCRLLPVVAPKHPANPLTECAQAIEAPLHFIFVGDSTMKMQRNLFEIAFLGLGEDGREQSHYNDHQIRASFFDLSGGALKCNYQGGDHNITRFFESLKAREDKTLVNPERTVILFNTGLHDIHQLCSHQFASDRPSYLGDEIGADATQGFHCVVHYRYAVKGLAQEILNAPADLRVFQSTTAGWPKYGNWGITWPTDGGQNMPVSTEFVDFFNDIAYDVMKESFPTIPIMDGYWVSYARPDNREINKGPKQALAKKMSHPGIEVALALLRSWVTIVTQSDVCKRR